MKAFKEYGVPFQSSGCCEDHPSIAPTTKDAEDDDPMWEMNSIQDLSTNEEDVTLPPRIRCLAHTLALICTTDIKKPLGPNTVVHKSMAKATKFWTLCGRPKSAEVIKEKLGVLPKLPVVTRWNSLYDSLSMLLDHRANLNNVLAALNITKSFNQQDFEVYAEYILVTKPFAVGLDYLQGDSDLYYGAVIPTLLMIKKRLDEIDESSLKHCKKNLELAKEGLDKRFNNILTMNMDVEETRVAVIAAVSHPAFKLKWLSSNAKLCSEENRKKVLDLLAVELRTQLKEARLTNPRTTPTKTDLFFIFNNDTNALADADFQIQNYLARDFDLDTDSLRDFFRHFPGMEKIFRAYNTTLPSSGPVERFFSIAGYVYAPRRNRLNDENFKRLVVLKANQKLLATIKVQSSVPCPTHPASMIPPSLASAASSAAPSGEASSSSTAAPDEEAVQVLNSERSTGGKNHDSTTGRLVCLLI